MLRARRILLTTVVASCSALVAVVPGAGAADAPRSVPVAATSAAATTPIRHVVILYQENHSFDNVFGIFCVEHPRRRCNGVTHGRISTGQRIHLRHARDIPPVVRHRPKDQRRAMHGGEMDRFNLIPGCGQSTNYQCYSQFQREDVPALWRLAGQYVLSSRTFELDPVTSWASHMELASASLDGFLGYNPIGMPRDRYGWGCDSHGVSWWRSPGGEVSKQPSCIPKPDGSGPFRNSPVQWVPTIMNRLRNAGRSWRIYAADGAFTKANGEGYAWAICPTFADCLYTSMRKHLVRYENVLTAARNGNLPAFSIAIPPPRFSQHNGDSMIAGDNWIAKVVNAIGKGPDWRSTAIFITYDDCGCFYDHVAPPPGRGIRVPMVIVSPYAKRYYTDRNTANYASMLAYTEDVFGLRPLGPEDANAYDYRDSFNYNKEPSRFEPLPLTPVPASSIRYMALHPPKRLD